MEAAVAFGMEQAFRPAFSKAEEAIGLSRWGTGSLRARLRSRYLLQSQIPGSLVRELRQLLD